MVKGLRGSKRLKEKVTGRGEGEKRWKKKGRAKRERKDGRRRRKNKTKARESKIKKDRRMGRI